MLTPEEEKIIICGAEINYDTASAVERLADVMIETYNLFTQTVTDFSDRDGDYFAFIRERALTIKDLARDIKDRAEDRLNNGTKSKKGKK